MRYTIKIMGRAEIMRKASLQQLSKCIVISINCPNTPTNLQNENILDILKLEFHDIETPIDGLVPMSPQDGYKIKQFIDTHKDAVNLILIHCTAGISRSAGVGCALALYLNGEDDYLWASGKYMPSKRCYTLTLEALGLSITPQELEAKELLSTTGFTLMQKKQGSTWLNSMFS